MRSIFASALVFAMTNAENMDSREFEFMKYIATWNKSYGTREEFKLRLAEYLRMDDFINEVNAPDSEYKHTAAHNKFSDWTKDEYKRMLTLANAPKGMVEEMPLLETDPTVATPQSWDWRDHNCVTAVKNQE